MSNKKVKRTVTSEFHLELDEAKKLFEEFKKPLNQYVGIVMPNMVNTTNLTLGKAAEDAKRKKLRDKGCLVINISPDIKNPNIKEGDIVLFTDPHIIQFDKPKSIVIDGVFPSKREYIYLIVQYHGLLHTIDNPFVKIEEKNINDNNS